MLKPAPWIYAIIICLFLIRPILACEAPPEGFGIHEVRFLMQTQAYSYQYFETVELPDLTQACWVANTDGSFHADLPSGTKWSLTYIDANNPDAFDLIDQGELVVLDIEPASENAGFYKMTLSQTDHLRLGFTIFYSPTLKNYIFANQSFPMYVSSEGISVQVR